MRVLLASFARRLNHSVTGLATTTRRLSLRRPPGAEASILALFTERPAATLRTPRNEYKAGYAAAKLLIAERHLVDPVAALAVAFPAARSEFHWGAIDALTDAATGLPGALVVAWPAEAT